MKFIFKWQTFCQPQRANELCEDMSDHTKRILLKKVNSMIRAQTLEVEPDIDMEAKYLS